MKPLCQSVVNMQASPIRVMFDKAEKIPDAISFAVGEPGFTAASHITQAAKKCIDDGDTHYVANAGIYELRKAVSEYFHRKKQVDYTPEEIMITIGGMQALSGLMTVLLNPGDEVIIQDPCYTNYYGEIQLPGGIAVPVLQREEDDFQLREEDIRKAITPKTKAILINSPCNPTGGVLTERTLRMIAAICEEYDLYLISDEVYQDFVYDGAQYFSVLSIPGMKKRSILIDSVSKTFAMTGWRCGFLAADQSIISQLTKIQEYLVSCCTPIAQRAALAAITGPNDTLEQMKNQYAKNREIVIKEINSMPLLSLTKPKGAFYAFVNIKKTGLDSLTFCLRALEEHHVVFSPGMCFGQSGEGYIRMSYVTSEPDLVEGLRRLRAFVEKLEKEQ
ncbi:MAG: pyridoxal phosphate-dependent aminotransferase [Clostridiales bacterium]|nr:pyridoxal phosphate-dependent aminotransferase [Clostridiales bacterium]